MYLAVVSERPCYVFGHGNGLLSTGCVFFGGEGAVSGNLPWHWRGKVSWPLRDILCIGTLQVRVICLVCGTESLTRL